MDYKDRERYLNPKHYDNVFDPQEMLHQLFYKMKKSSESRYCWTDNQGILFFEEVEKTVLNNIQIAAKKIGKFIVDKDIQIKECDSMVPWTHRTAEE